MAEAAGVEPASENAPLIVLLAGGCRGPIDAAAHEELMRQTGEASFTVFPTLVRRGKKTYDAASAEKIGGFLDGGRLGHSTLSAETVDVSGEWHANEARIFRESAASLGEHVKTHPIRTRYALMAECLVGRGGAPIGIHGYIVDAEGRLAGGFLLNSHHELFARAEPRTVEDCTRVVTEALPGELKRA